MENSDFGKRRYYEKILKAYKNIADFYTCEQSMIKNIPNDLICEDSIIYKTSVMVIAPVLISYVFYVLKDSQKRGIERLYFLSRDGYIMYKISKVLCEYYHLNIECRYVYVSRFALRSSLYLINKEEAMDHFCESGVKISIKVVLQRAGISEEVQKKLFDKLHIQNVNSPLTDKQLKQLKEKLKKNPLFEKEALIYAKEKYRNIYEYFVQEGFFEEKEYAIVDVGWMGSMQRHIKKILTHAGNYRNMHGYYFAMFERGKKEDGQYHCFYFSKEFNNSRRVLFNNNLFECMCSANHGMTIGYNKNNEGITVPIFKNYQDKWNVDLQLDTIEQFAKEFVSINEWSNIGVDELPRLSKKLLMSFMIFPSLSEATAYGNIPFCDDFTENYLSNLATYLTKDELWQYNFFYKIYKRIFFKVEKEKINKSFWINGTIKLSDIRYKRLFNLCCVVNEYIHYLIISRKR